MSMSALVAQAASDRVFEFQLTACFSLLGLVLSVAMIFASPGTAAAVALLPG